MVNAYCAIAGVTVLLWVPNLLRFYRSWVTRRHPVSLAICAVIITLIWLAIAGIWAVNGSVRIEVISLVSIGISAAVASFTNLTFYWAGKRFDDDRED